MDVREIRRVLPHRFPILLIDRVDEIEPGVSLVATKAVTVNEPCYAGLPDDVDHAYPPTLLVESWCQAAGMLVLRDQPNPEVLNSQVLLFGTITGLELPVPVHPGDVVRHQARAVKLLSDAAVLQGESLVNGVAVMRVRQVLIALRPADSLVAQ